MKQTKTVSVTSGKGGVGKSTLVANLAQYLVSQGDKVLVFDGDLGLANLDIFFGVRPEGTLLEVINGEKSVRDILCEVGPGISLLSGGSALPEFNSMNNFQRRSLIDSVKELPHEFDWMLIDTAAGISDNVLYLNSRADQIIIVLTPDPSSFADAYALIKVMSKKYQTKKFTLICNQVRDEQEGFSLYSRFHDVVGRFLEVSLNFIGSIPMDIAMKQNNRMQRLILKHDLNAPSASAIRRIGAGLNRYSEIQQAGSLEQYWQQVVGFA